MVIDRDRPRGYAQNVALVLQTASYTSVSSLGSRSGDTEVEKEITAYRYVRALVMACIPIDGETAAYVQNTCVASPIKKKKPILRTNPRLEAPRPPFILRTTFRTSAITPASPLIRKFTTLRLVLSPQCGKATAVFVSSRHRDFVAQVGKCGSRSLDLLFLVLVLWTSFFFAALIDEQYSYVRAFSEQSLTM